LRIYNTQTRGKQEFIPVEQGKVTIYACGPTVYNFFHIGNARPFIIFDTLRRYFEYIGYDVTFVQNFTDVDDKMIEISKREGIPLSELGKKYIDAYFEDAKGLGIKDADFHPMATKHMGEIIQLVKKLIENGHAYEVEGDVYYDVSSFEKYGKLSGQSLEDLQAGARIDVTDIKRNPEDFALWKAAKPGEESWDSPWGKGRPGWHIECSAMSMKYLGETIDIHGGGQDLIFPHHENEIAQSEGATGKPFVNYWMHNGYINIDNKKMSKSKGNFFTVRDIAQKYDLGIVRLFMLSAHYRNPINFSEELIEQAEAAMTRIKTCRENLQFISEQGSEDVVEVVEMITNFEKRFKEEMDDDLNTAGAVGAIFEYIKDVNLAFAENKGKNSALQALEVLDKILGVLGIEPKDDSVPEDILALANERQAARADKDFAKADALRDKIAALGYEMKDTPEGVKIKKK
jgi:cysteinyl-tRNA synthetase